MEEPSVLDYLKALLTPWRGDIPVIPPLPGVEPASEEVGSQTVEIALDADEMLVEPEVAIAPSAESTQAMVLPWRSLLAVLLALFAQRSFEPSPGRTWAAGVILYAIALGSLVLADLRSEWRLPLLAVNGAVDAKARQHPYQIRTRLLFLSLPFSLIAFLTFGGNRFTLLNVSFWLVGIILLVIALWQSDPHLLSLRQRITASFGSWRLQVSLSPGTLLVLVIAALVVFFRVYRIDQVPPEMVSDHAEKLLDVWDVVHGQTSIFFPRNTGREAIQMYLTAGIVQVLGTGYSFISLKIGTVLAGLLTLPFIYLLGKEVGNKRVGWLAVLFAGIAYWPNVISRAGLRFPLYPLFVAPVLYFLVRGLRRSSLNDFILSGLFLGVGLHGYTPIRILPLVVIAAVGLYWLHSQSVGHRKEALWGLLVLGTVAFVVFLPLLRYAFESPDMFSYRSFTRLGTVEQPLPGPGWEIFLSNLWKGVTMFFWDDGEIWVHSVTHRPGLDVISAAFFILGIGLIVIRYIRQRHWLDPFMLLSVPLLLMPSILSLAFPAENPALNRMGGAIVPVFVIIALAFDSFIHAVSTSLRAPRGAIVSWGLAVVLVLLAVFQNYDLVFNQYQSYYKTASWNTSEMGKLIRNFADSVGSPDTAWVVAYPYWVDTRLVGMNAGYPLKDYAIQTSDLSGTLTEGRTKLFLINPNDRANLEALQSLYPQGVLEEYASEIEGHRFLIYFVPADQ